MLSELSVGAIVLAPKFNLSLSNPLCLFKSQVVSVGQSSTLMDAEQLHLSILVHLLLLLHFNLFYLLFPHHSSDLPGFFSSPPSPSPFLLS